MQETQSLSNVEPAIRQALEYVRARANEEPNPSKRSAILSQGSKLAVLWDETVAIIQSPDGRVQ